LLTTSTSIRCRWWRVAAKAEDQYGARIPDEDLAGLRTVSDVVSYIKRLEEENPDAAAAIRAHIKDQTTN
jgi:acyl carrier protein